MIDAMPELPPEERIQRLVDQYVADIHPELPLLNHIPVEHIRVDCAQDYLRYAMASIAAQSQRTPSSIQEAESLWWTANFLIAWSLEIDNREARNDDLFFAVSHLVRSCIKGRAEKITVGHFGGTWDTHVR